MRTLQEQDKADLDAMTKKLQALALLSLHERNLVSILAEIVDTAISISGADFGNIQVLDPRTGDLRIAAQRGFPKWWLDFWNSVSKGKGACGTALESGKRIIVEDVERSPIFAGTPALDIQLKAGVRAVQSTPLVSRSGKPIGMFSTHYRKPHRPDDRSLRLLDLLGRQAADIIDRAQTEEQLAFQANLLSRVHDAIVAYDEQLRITYWNEVAEEIFGWTGKEVIGNDSSQVFRPNLPEETIRAGIRRLIEAGHAEGEVYYRHKKGHYVLVRVRAAVLKGQGGEFKGVVTSMRDITERKEMQDRLERARTFSDELNRINLLVHSSLDAGSVMESALAGAKEALGADGAAVGLFEKGSGKDVVVRYYLNVPEALKDARCSPVQMKGILNVVSRWDAFAFNDIPADDRVNADFWISFGYRSLLAAPLMTRNEVIGAIMFLSGNPCSFDDMHTDFARKIGVSLSLAFENARLYEQRGKMEKKLRHMAHHDPLTGLPNLRLFLDIIELERRKADRNQKKMAVLFLDLDRFKEVNDTLGHNVGNLLLQKVSSRLKSHLRKSDTIARIGGDEFIIILTDITRPEDVADIAGNIVTSFSNPFRIDRHELNITASMGISIYPDDNNDIDALLRYADISMYVAKELGRNRYQFYNRSVNVKSLERLRMEALLKRSLDLGEMEIYYQPVVDIRTRRVESAEALARWRHPEKGLLLPKDFIAAAEETGFIDELGEWALKTVCRQVRSWLDAGGPHVRVVVNLSARQFQDPELVDNMRSILKEMELPPGTLGVEITETIAMRDVEQSVARMRDLQGMGIKISIDDFGTGYSSLNYLKRMPIERLKIDRTFIRDVANDPDRSIVQAVTEMAHGMKMKVVAKGVETEKQLEFVSRTGCDEMQGFLYSKPLSADELKDFLKTA